MQKIGSYLVFYLIKLISFLPLWFLYLISNLLSFFLYRIFGYRKKVIFNNLKQSFPEKSEHEIKRIASKYYRYLADILVETIYSFSITEKELYKRVTFTNEELYLKYSNLGKPIILVMGHYANWEWFGLRGGMYLPDYVYSLYKKMKNKTINDLVVTNRQRFGLRLIEERSSYSKLPKILVHDQVPSNTVAFIADQTALPDRGVWTDFLNQKTIFFKGPEAYAKKFDCVVLFIGIRRVSRGNYLVYGDVITDDAPSCDDGFIVKEFARNLEDQIKEEPAYWIWSHRRWKHQYKEEYEQNNASKPKE